MSKILTTLITTIAVSAVSLCNVFSASAATQKYKAYKIYLSAPENTYAQIFNANVSYNPNNTIYLGKEDGSLSGNFYVSDVAISSTSRKTYVNYSNTSPYRYAGEFGSLTFKTTNSYAPTVSLTQLTNDRGNSLSLSLVKVDKILMGDANLDGVVNNDDVLYIQGIALGNYPNLTYIQRIAADVNQDSFFTVADAAQVDSYVNGNCDCVLG